jgi:hypothetical protein
MNFLSRHPIMKTPLTRSALSLNSGPACLLTCALALALLLVATLPRAHAAGPPEAMTYQGFLVDANGNPLAPSTPANYPVIFRIFPAPSGGASLWSEQQIVTVDKGNFSVILSEGSAVGAEPKPLLSTVLSTNGADRYIQISVTIGTTTSDMLPRLRLLPSPYAFLATSANNLVSPAGVPVIRYANNQVEVTGNVQASGVISGNGSGLTGLTVGQVSGTFADSQLSANVARRDVGNAFTGNQTISGNLGLGTVNTTFPLTIGNNTGGDKISLYGQSGNSYGFGIQGGILQIHTLDAGSDVVFGYGSSAAMTETMRIKGNGNVGIGTTLPNARLSLVAPGASEVQGAALSTTLRTSSGPLGTTVNSELTLANFGFHSGNNSSLGIRAIRATAGGAWETAAVGLGMDVDNTPRAGGASLWLHGNGNIGIGTTTPNVKLDVNGGIFATSLAVNGPVSATTFTGTFNGEKPPVTFTVPTSLPGNLASYREVLVDTAALLGDADGGRIKVVLRNHSNRTVRTYSIQFYAEQDSDFGKTQADGRYFWTINSYNQEYGDQLIGKGGAFRTDVAAAPWSWMFIRNYSTGAATGAGDGPAFDFANRYKFYFLVSPNVTATVTLYDR